MDFDPKEAGTSEDPLAWAALEPEIRAALADHVDIELAKRALPGALVYFVCVVAVGLSTTYYRDHPLFLSSVGILTLAAGTLRMVTAKRLLRRSRESLSGAKPLFLLSTYAAFGI